MLSWSDTLKGYGTFLLRRALFIAALCSIASAAHAEGWMCTGEHSAGVSHDADGDWKGMRFDNPGTFTITPNKRNTEKPYTVKLLGTEVPYAYCRPMSDNGWLFCTGRARLELNTNNSRFLYFQSLRSFTSVGDNDFEGKGITDENAGDALLTIGSCSTF